MAYFTDKENQAMPAEFREFERKMIHAKYKSVVERLKIGRLFSNRQV
jgi:hypothetical protein